MQARTGTAVVILTIAVLTTGCAVDFKAFYEPKPKTQPSAELRAAQQRLADLGLYAGRADGLWGPATEAGLQRLQKSRGIEATGQADASTLAALEVGSPRLPVSALNG